MKSILISIKPKYVADILNGRKTIEIRKTMPKCDLPIDVYIYCTKQEYPEITLYSQENEFGGYMEHIGNGKVVAKFTLNKVEEMRPFFHWCEILQKKTCLSYDEVLNYLDKSEYITAKKQEIVYAWHISNLEIFDKPKLLNNFKIRKRFVDDWGNYFYASQYLRKPPQSYCFVEKE